jgi:beta-glucosidase/6-phospho-beta-glucosidase/beta-galactosidase
MHHAHMSQSINKLLASVEWTRVASECDGKQHEEQAVDHWREVAVEQPRK